MTSVKKRAKRSPMRSGALSAKSAGLFGSAERIDSNRCGAHAHAWKRKQF